MTGSRSKSPLFASALAIARAELKSGVRDRQAMLYSVLLPLFLYPVLFWVLLQVFLTVEASKEATHLDVAIVYEEEARERAAELAEVLFANDRETTRVALAAGPKAGSVERADLAGEGAGASDLVLFVRAPREGEAPLHLYHDSARAQGELALERAEDELARLARERRDAALGGIESHDSFRYETRSLSQEEDLGGYLLSTMLPMMIVIMAFLGAFFPAVDLTAGEVERGTAETTSLLPVPRLALRLGKILAVAVGSLCATLLNLAGMALATEALLGLFPSGMPNLSVPFWPLVQLVPLLLLFVLFTSAALVAVASLGKTFAQAQANLGTLQAIFIFPAMIAMFPGIELELGLAWIPVVQVALGFKAILVGAASEKGLELAIVAVSLLAYTGLALYLSLRLTSREGLEGIANKFSLGRLWKVLLSSDATPH